MIVLIRPIITEKTLSQASTGQYTFEIDRRANAIQVALAVADRYKVTVTDVHVLNISGVERRTRRGIGRTRSWKKAIITLKKGDKIAGFEIETEDDHSHKPAKEAKAKVG